jgi:carbamoylphosphate synthase large subunit
MSLAWVQRRYDYLVSFMARGESSLWPGCKEELLTGMIMTIGDVFDESLIMNF